MTTRIALVVGGCVCLCWGAYPQEGPPPAKVVVATIEEGTLTPTSEFKGTVYFKEVSRVATEVSGKVIEVLFEEAEHLEEGAPMVRLDDALLKTALNAAKALYEQSKTQLAQEEVRLARAELLLEDEVTVPQDYDDLKFTVESLTHKVAAYKAEADRLELEIAKQTTRAPYDGVVIERLTELGEWKSGGSTVAEFARDKVFDVMVNLPEENLPWLKVGDGVAVMGRGQAFPGRIEAVIPRGDVNTRTFPVKIRVEGQEGLLEGMTTQVRLPIGERVDCLLIPRDAVLLEAGRDIVVVVREGRAGRVPVQVIGHDGLSAGVQGDGLEAGMSVVVKGHERVRDGQPVEVME